MEPDEYIKSFFENIKSQLQGTRLDADGKSASYKNMVVAAAWANELWDVQLQNEASEPIRRQYDPTKARSSEAAANCFVDALRRASGQEPIVRPESLVRHFRAGRPKTTTTT